MQSPIANDFLKVSLGGHAETQLVKKFLLYFHAQELHKKFVSPPE